MYLLSEKLRRAGFTHGFTTREGGISPPPFSTLNLALPAVVPTGGRSVIFEDSSENLRRNLHKIAHALNIRTEDIFQLRQVHGVRVLRLPNDRDAWHPPFDIPEGDALIAVPSTTKERLCVGVRTADCVPILIGERSSGMVGAIHAGWRGLVAGIVEAASAPFVAADRAGTVAAIGPSIGPCCFEVGEDVARQIARAAPPGIIRTLRGKAHADLRLATRLRLQAAGILDENIDDVPGCSRCNSELFFSYRRDGHLSGRHLALIATRTTQPAGSLHGN